MRFYLHGDCQPEIAAALARHDHATHKASELEGLDPDAGGDPALLLPLLAKQQWNLLTTDTTLVRDVYEKKILFGGIIVLILEDPDKNRDPNQAIDRLFERYPRLNPGRLYTLTPNRVKIRQLPGANAL